MVKESCKGVKDKIIILLQSTLGEKIKFQGRSICYESIRRRSQNRNKCCKSLQDNK